MPVTPTTGKFGSNKVVFVVDGYDMLGAKPQEMSFKWILATERSDGLGDSWPEHSATGMRGAELVQGGAFFKTEPLGGHAALKDVTPTDPNGPPRIVVVGAAGNAIGQPMVGFEGVLQPEYEVLGRVGSLTRANAAWLVSGRAEDGIILQNMVAKTVDWNTKTDGAEVDYTLAPQRAIPITSNSLANPTVVTTPVPHGLATGAIILISGVITSNPTINGERVATVISPTTFSVPVNVTTAGTGGSFVRSNTSNGAAGYQEVVAFSGFSGFVGKIRTSPDNTTFADLITFANVTAAPNAQRVTVAGVIDRYVSFDGNVTGAGSITILVGLARL